MSADLDVAKATLYSMIREYEGLYLTAYQCPAGVWTIGYGSTGPDIVQGLVWTQEKAEAAMRKEADACVKAVLTLVPDASTGVLVALADFAYNLGVARLASSTMLKKIKAGDMANAALECKKWVWGGGKVLPGLVRRRAAEAILILAPATPSKT